MQALNHTPSQATPPRRAGFAGFTLAEMLIVLAIIGILMAILLPVISRVKGTAKGTACMSNMQQLGKAFQLYVQDSGRRFPGGGEFQNWGKGGHWVGGIDGKNLAGVNPPYDYQTPNTALPENGALYTYVRNANVYVCPAIQDGDLKRLSYSMNCAIAWMHEVRIKAPSDIVLLVDEDKSLNDGFFWATNDSSSTDSFTKTHNGNGNLLFADYHAKSYTFEKFPLAENNPTTNPDGAAAATQSAAMKAAGSKTAPAAPGTPHFHDPAFGSPGGSNPRDLSVSGSTTDSCKQ